jgi:hypothetical protein
MLIYHYSRKPEIAPLRGLCEELWAGITTVLPAALWAEKQYVHIVGAHVPSYAEYVSI